MNLQLKTSADAAVVKIERIAPVIFRSGKSSFICSKFSVPRSFHELPSQPLVFPQCVFALQKTVTCTDHTLIFEPHRLLQEAKLFTAQTDTT